MNAMYLSGLVWKGEDETTKLKNKYSIHIKNSTKQNTAIIISFLYDHTYVALFCRYSVIVQQCKTHFKVLA